MFKGQPGIWERNNEFQALISFDLKWKLAVWELRRSGNKMSSLVYSTHPGPECWASHLFLSPADMKVNNYREEKAEQKSASCLLRHGAQSIVHTLQWRADTNIFYSFILYNFQLHRPNWNKASYSSFSSSSMLFVGGLICLEQKFFSLIVFYIGPFFKLKY